MAELVAVFAVIDLLEMKQLAKDQFKMDILYGDTDSILVSCINVVLVNKKRCIGIQVDGKVIIRKWKVRKDIDLHSSIRYSAS